MTRGTTLFAAIVLLSAVCLPDSARAQYGPSGIGGGVQTISGNGTVKLTRPPTVLRMYVELIGKGKTPEEALAKLKERREAALARLETLDAREDSIACGMPSFMKRQPAPVGWVVPTADPYYAPRTYSVPAIPSGNIRPSYVPPTVMPPTVRMVPRRSVRVVKTFSASAVLTAEWSIKADSPEESLLLSRALEKKLKAADLSDVKALKRQMSPEEQELAEEALPQPVPIGVQPVVIGQPVFAYVAEVAAEDRDQAVAEAFGKAKAQASQLARAAGVKVGPLAGLSGRNYMDTTGTVSQPYWRTLERREAGGSKDSPNRATIATFGPVRFVFRVMVIYKLEE